MIHACAMLTAALALAFSTALEVQFSLPKLLVVRAGAILIGIIWIHRATRGAVNGLPRAVMVTAALLLVWWIVAALNAVHIPTALAGAHGRYNGLWMHATWLLLALAIATARLDATEIARMCRWMVIAVVPAALYAIVQFAGLDPIAWPGPRSASTIGNPVVLAATLGLFAPLALAFALFARAASGRVAWAVATVILLGGAVTTLSRGPLVATAFALFLVAAASIAGRRRPISLRAMSIAAAIVLVIAVAGFRQVLEVRARLMGDNEASRTLADRRNTYDAAWRIVTDRPLLGVGFENFSIVYPHYRHPASEQVTPNVLPTMVHSGYLQAAATTGVVGLALYLAFVAAVVATLFRSWRTIRDRHQRMLIAALTASILGYLIQDLSGWLEVSATTFFYMIVGAALAMSQSSVSSAVDTAWRSRIIPGAAIVTTLCAALTIEAAELMRVDRLMHRARLLAAQQQWDQAATAMTSALASRARLPAEYFTFAASRYADHYSATNDASSYEEAAALFDEAAARNRFAASPRINRLLLDSLAIQRQLPVTGVDSRAAALAALDSNNGAVHVALARVYLAQVRYDEAIAALAAAERLRPADPRHDELLGDIEHARHNTAAAVASYREAVAAYEAEDRALWIAASRKLILGMIESGFAAEASAHADRVLAAYPRESLVHTLRGYARVALGDGAEAKRAFQTALSLDPANESARQGLASIR